MTYNTCLRNCAAGKCAVALQNAGMCQGIQNDPQVAACLNDCLNIQDVGSPDTVVQSQTGSSAVVAGGSNCQVVKGNGAFNADGTPGFAVSHPVCQTSALPANDTQAQTQLQANAATNCQNFCYQTATGQKCVQHCKDSGGGETATPSWQADVKPADVSKVLPDQSDDHLLVQENTKQMEVDTSESDVKRRDLSSAILNAPTDSSN